MLPASPGQYDQPIALDLSMRTRAELRAHDLEVRLDGFPQDVASDRAYYKSASSRPATRSSFPLRLRPVSLWPTSVALKYRVP